MMIVWTCPGIRLLEEERGRRLRRNRLVERLRRASVSMLDSEQLPWLAVPGELTREKECFQTTGVGVGFQPFSHREGRAS